MRSRMNEQAQEFKVAFDYCRIARFQCLGQSLFDFSSLLRAFLCLNQYFFDVVGSFLVFESITKNLVPLQQKSKAIECQLRTEVRINHSLQFYLDSMEACKSQCQLSFSEADPWRFAKITQWQIYR